VELCTGKAAEDDSIGARLLADIRGIFHPKDDDGKALPPLDRIASKDLAEALGAMEERPWAEWGKQQDPMSQAQLARQLNKFSVTPKGFRLPDDRRLTGYERGQFADAWACYVAPGAAPDDASCPCSPASNRDSVTTRVNTGQDGDSQSVTATERHASENGISANKDAPCHGVTPSNPSDGARPDHLGLFEGQSVAGKPMGHHNL